MLVVVGGIPHPTVGASLVLYHYYIQGLKEAGFDILNLLLLQPDNSDEAKFAEYRREMESPNFRILPCCSPRFVRTNRFWHSFDRAAMQSVRAEVEAFGADVTLCLDLASAWAVEGWRVGRRIAWLGDLNFQTFLYHALYARAEGEADIRFVLVNHWHAFLWKRLYARILKGFASVIVASKSSETEMAKLGVKASYLPYPWPSEPSQVPANRNAKPTFFFFGQLQGLGSRSAFHAMERGIYPALKTVWGAGGFEILIGGRGGLPDWVQTAVADKPEFRYLGFVEDLDPVLAGCHAVLAPIDVPVGNRSRVLTALSKCALVVAHRNTALGNPDLVDGVSCYLAETSEDFLDRLRRAVEEPDEAAAVAERGYQVYKTRFSPNVAVPPLVEIVRNVATGAALNDAKGIS